MSTRTTAAPGRVKTGMNAFEQRIIRSAIEFTRADRESAGEHKALREQFPAILNPIREQDLFAGILEHSNYLVKVSTLTRRDSAGITT